MLAIVRNYGGTAAIVAQVTVPRPLAANSVVYDVQSQARLETPGDNHVIKVPLEPGQARLIYVGPNSRWIDRIPK
jgi:hypothetical protein